MYILLYICIERNNKTMIIENFEFDNYTFNGVTYNLLIDVEVTEVEIDNDGIGSYDYGSARCFDTGENYVNILDFDLLDVFFYINEKEIEIKLNKQEEETLKDYICEDLQQENQEQLDEFYI